ncbi:class I SAM-dependent methyltransferase [Actinotalea ferrariae]|uniref:class I SAM-dependent methyltransferase n=1 Tax=Actinotalea ferrariae TaxID=1386098 RepID=UPI001C8B1159|nr:class I SAM-dependent methyltransferase [Actinotalea ferrariae]MBX9246161.1 class I SAM-dependent methyltransferase [Actinotalea ferrariae]
MTSPTRPRQQLDLPSPSHDPFWNHNTHYHRLVPRVAPPPWRRVLDVGCGEGLLTRRLAPATTDEVVGVDVDADQVRRAEAAADSPHLRYVAGDVLGLDLGRPFDLVTCVATLHHLPLRQGLTRLRELTAPGGTLVVVGLADPSSPVDVATGALGLVASRWARWRRGEWDARVPLVDAFPVLGDVRAAARELLPGSQLRRRLYWRYSLVWTAPG